MRAYNGILIVKPLESSKFNLTTPTRVLKGKVIDVGNPLTTDFGTVISTSVKKGDTVYFLSYEGDYDKIDKDTYVVKFQDLRAYE